MLFSAGSTVCSCCHIRNWNQLWHSPQTREVYLCTKWLLIIKLIVAFMCVKGGQKM